MNITESNTLSSTQKEAIIRLWNEEYPKALSLGSMTDLERYLEGLSNKCHYILNDGQGSTKGWLVTFVREGEQYFAMVLDHSVQGKGLGSRLLALVKKQHAELNGWVIDKDTELRNNGEVYRSPLGFYRKNGFNSVPGSVLLKKGVHGVKVRWER